MQLFRNDYKLTGSWDLLPASLKLVRENFWPIFYLTLLPRLIITIGLVIGNSVADKQYEQLSSELVVCYIILLIGSAWTLLAYPGYINMQLDALDGKSPEAWDCFKSGLSYIVPFLMLVLMAVLGIFFGLMLFIIPGLIIIRGILLSMYYLIDKNLRPLEALKQSYTESKHHAGYIWGIIGVGVVLNTTSSLVGRIPVVGYLLAITLSLPYIFLPVLRYKEIQTFETDELRSSKTSQL